LPLSYFLVLAIRGVRILNSFFNLNKISQSAVVDTTLSEFPVLLHDYPLPPLTTGIIKPRILISKNAYQTLSRSELNLVIQHEEKHIRRADGSSNLLRILVREVLFFSPFIWKLSQKFEEEMEISVDAAVLASSNQTSHTYGSLLLKMADLSQPVCATKAVGAFLSNSSIKRRIISMREIPKRRAKILSGFATAMFMILSTLGISLFGNQAYSYSNKLEFFLMNPSETEPHGKPILTEADFDSGIVAPNCIEKCVLSLHMIPASQKRFSKLSTENIGNRIAIVLDGKLISSPILKVAITSQALQITGDLSKQDAHKIVSRIGRGLK
jgi:hypothetical protein